MTRRARDFVKSCPGFIAAGLLIVCFGMLSLAAEANADLPALKRDGALSIIEGGSYECVFMPKGASPVVSMNSIICAKGFDVRVWQEVDGNPWTRTFENGAMTPSFETRQGEILATAKWSNDKFSAATSFVMKKESLEISARLTALQRSEMKFTRATIELNPEWSVFAGAKVSYERENGEAGSLLLPAIPTEDEKYVLLLSGKFREIEMSGMNGLPGAKMRLSGMDRVTIEQTGARFRLHFGLSKEDVTDALEKGSVLRLNLSLRFVDVEKAAPRNEKARVAVDAATPGKSVSPYVFGANLDDRIGVGKKLPEMRHPYQNNFNYDKDAERYAKESGATFFRVYLHTLYDTLGWAGSDTSRDPISPCDGAPCDYSKADSFVDGLRKNGIELMPCLGLYCPPWLSSDRPSGKRVGLIRLHRSPPKDNAKWAAIMAGLVKHWNVEKGYGIKFWQIGNEPDGWDYYWLRGTVPEFVECFKAGAAAMKEADPSIKISGPDLANIRSKAWPENKLFWKDEFAKSCKDSFDNFSFNCYCTDDFSKALGDAREALKNAGAEGKTVYIAEYNITGLNYDNPAIFDFSGAAFIARSLKSLIENGVDRASFYAFYHPSLGFFDYGENGELVPRPSYYAFKMHAALGSLKNGTVLKNNCDAKDLSVLSCKHADGKGFTAIFSSDAANVKNFSVDLKFDNVNGEYAMKRYQLVPGSALKESPEEVRRLGQALKLDLPGRAVTALVFREK